MSLFTQHTLAAVLDCSTQLLERNRWEGKGVPYLKIGRKVLYRKSDVLSLSSSMGHVVDKNFSDLAIPGTFATFY